MGSEFLDQWYDVLRNCSYDNTYKMAWSKALVEIALETDFDNDISLFEISLHQISEKVLKYYWNQTIFFNLIQGSNPLKPPKVLQLTKNLIEIYQEENGTLPIRLERAEYKIKNNKALNKHYEKTVKSITTALKADVSYRFLNLNRTQLNLYQYAKGDNSLFFDRSHLLILKNNAQCLFDTTNYRWSLILETFNNTPRICKKVRINDDEDIKRKPLNKYMQYLDLDNPRHICFICQKTIDPSSLSIDHVIPWSFMYSDDLWNLVYAHRSCNSSKSNSVPDESIIKRLEERNKRLLTELETIKNNKITEELKTAVQLDYVRKFWIACRG